MERDFTGIVSLLDKAMCDLNKLREDEDMLDFYKCPAGRKFFDSDVPKIVKTLNKIAMSLENKMISQGDKGVPADVKVSEDKDIPAYMKISGDNVFFVGHLIDGTEYKVSRLRYSNDSIEYFVYVNDEVMESFGTVIEAFEAIAKEIE